MFSGEVDPNGINYCIHLYNEYFWININSLYSILSTC